MIFVGLMGKQFETVKTTSQNTAWGSSAIKF